MQKPAQNWPIGLLQHVIINADIFLHSSCYSNLICTNLISVIDFSSAFLPASVMLPPHRLRTLLNQAVELQKEKCPYHNSKLEVGMHSFSLLTDHLCSR